LTMEQDRLARTIDTHVQRITVNEGTDEDLLVSLYNHMTAFKQLLDTTTEDDMALLLEYYPGFYRFAKLLEQLAEGIADGRIPVPK